MIVLWINSLIFKCIFIYRGHKHYGVWFTY
jgi:hypothetical protein